MWENRRLFNCAGEGKGPRNARGWSLGFNVVLLGSLNSTVFSMLLSLEGRVGLCMYTLIGVYTFAFGGVSSVVSISVRVSI